MVFCKFFKLRWVTLKEGCNPNVERIDVAFGIQLATLMEKVHAMYPSHTNWLQIQATRQKAGETCDDYRSQMEECFQKFSSLAVDNPAHGDLLKTLVVNGLFPHIKEKELMHENYGFGSVSAPFAAMCGWARLAYLLFHILLFLSLRN
ncbi:hypothetical protein AAFF_G00431080 [Aldrovandia affinis]|uniref:Uncharacterized protein n=1 Tax=Aldrovandia affinis TaxID=143900 RepID=A0AAD7SB07_9TELE|nr:hypothetical protein AAFF_G00431080 [Aldrovandia affinis]